MFFYSVTIQYCTVVIVYLSCFAFIGNHEISLNCYSYINIQQISYIKTFSSVSFKTLFHIRKQFFMIIAAIVINLFLFCFFSVRLLSVLRGSSPLQRPINNNHVDFYQVKNDENLNLHVANIGYI